MNPQSIISYVGKAGDDPVTANLTESFDSPQKIQNEHELPATFLAHEIRNPLTNVSLAIEMLGSLNNNEDQKIYMEIIKRGSTRINDLINELLKYQAPHETESEK